MMKGCIFDIAECSIHDGPGLRITVFFKGCPLQCRWCHSPEGQRREPEILRFDGMPPRLCGRIWEASDLATHLKKLCAWLPQGGITFSGGEPLLQAEFLQEVTANLEGIHLLLDTCGVAPAVKFLETVRQMSCVFFGVKLLNDPDSIKWTGQPCSPALENLLKLDRECDTPYRLRIPLLAGVTGTDQYFRELLTLCGQLKRVEKIDFLPSNANAGAKYKACGRLFAPGFDICQPVVIPPWFRPEVPFHLLAADEIE